VALPEPLKPDTLTGSLMIILNSENGGFTLRNFFTINCFACSRCFISSDLPVKKINFRGEIVIAFLCDHCVEDNEEQGKVNVLGLVDGTKIYHWTELDHQPVIGKLANAPKKGSATLRLVKS
jgi:hypothetical protein